MRTYKYSLRNFFFISAAALVVLPFFTGMPTAQTQEQEAKSEIAQWIEQLGNDDYHVREAAHEKLREAGMKAAQELQKATENSDKEIVLRVQELLQEIEYEWTSVSDLPVVLEMMNTYSKATTHQEKIAVVASLATAQVWAENTRFTNGQGIGALCRIMQFEHDVRVRAEAVRGVIAVPPCRYSVRNQWFTKARDMIVDPEDDFLLQLVCNFSEIREEAVLFREEHLFAKTPVTPPEDLVRRIRKLAADMHAFRANAAYQTGREGTEQDILFLYALAELQDAARMEPERDETLRQALDVIPVTNDNGISPYMSHFLASMYLAERYMSDWARNEVLLVAEKEETLRAMAYTRAGHFSELMNDYEDAAKYFGLAVELTVDPKAAANGLFNGNRNMLVANHKQAQAMCCVERGEIETAKTLLEEAVTAYSTHVDALILRYQIGKDDKEYEKKTKELIDTFIANQKRMIQQYVRVQGIQEQFTQPFNQSAWLLANTEGEFKYAMNCAQKATQLDPENPSLLDTLAHVHALGGEKDKAVETQRTVVKMAPGALLFRKILEGFEQ